MNPLAAFFGSNSALPFAVGTAMPMATPVAWTLVLANSALAVLLLSIPLALVVLRRTRGLPVASGLYLLLGALMVVASLSRATAVWALWHPDPAVDAVLQALTAVLAIAAAAVLWRRATSLLQVPGLRGDAPAAGGRGGIARPSTDDAAQHLGGMLASIGAGYITTDRRGAITRMNAVAEAVTGWTASKAAGQPLWQVFEREHQPADAAVRNPVDDLLARGPALDLPLQVVVVGRAEPGAATPRTAVELRATPICAAADPANGHPTGKVWGMTMMFRDVTPLQFAQAEASRLAAIVASSHDAIIGKTLDDRVSSWNPAAEALFGWTAAEMIGQPIDTLIPPERSAEEMLVLAQLSRGDRVAAFDTQRLTRSGRRLDVSITISPIRDGTGRIAGASKIVRDISEQKAAEAALRESEARLLLTLEAAQLGEWSVDLETGVARQSPRHDRCFGYDRPVPDWTLERFYDHVHTDDRDGIRRQFEQMRARGGALQAECRVLWPDGSVHWIRINGSALGTGRGEGRDEAGNGNSVVNGNSGAGGRGSHGGDGSRSFRMLGVVSDITQRKQAEAAQREAQRLEAENQQILEASRAKNLFLANMSHELRTPLNAVIGFSDLLRAGAVAPGSPKQAEYLGHIGASGRHLLNLINDVLDLSKVEAGKFSFYPEEVVLHDLVQDVQHTLETALRTKRIDLRTEIDAAVDQLTLDPGRLKQVLYNYLSNAIKFTPDGGRVILRALPEGAQHLRIEVEDTGIGIEGADLSKLFQDFQQLEAGHARQHQGTGLGLSLTRQLVELQGGRVGVRSQSGQGSVFHMVLPKRPEFASVRPDRQRLLLIGPTLDGGSGAAGVLTQAGFSVDEAVTGASAMRQAAGQSYDALTLDLLLPDERGLDVLQRIRRDTDNRDAAVLGMSLTVDGERSVAFAIADVLTKPLSLRAIETAMSRLPSTQPPEGPRRVVVVDDEPLSVDLMVAALQRMGIDAHGFGDGRSALNALARIQPEAMVLDLIMPGMDGLAVLDALRRVPEWQQLPVFIWTRMLPSDDEYAELKQSAGRIVGRGGGEIQLLLDRLCRWRPPLVDGEATGGEGDALDRDDRGGSNSVLPGHAR